MSAIKVIATVKKITESEARRFCLQVQSYFPNVPSFQKIAQAVQNSPNVTPKEVALSIDPKLSNKSRGRTSISKGRLNAADSILKSKRFPKRPLSRLSDEELVAGIADLIHGEDKGNKDIARQFLIDLNRQRPDLPLLRNEEILKIVNRVSRKGDWNLEEVVPQVRRKLYDYKSDPDKIHIIYTPMGGKSK